MADLDRLGSPFAGMANFSAETPVRVLSPDEIDKMLADHSLHLEMEYHTSARRSSGDELERGEPVGCASGRRESLQDGARWRRSCGGSLYGIQFLNCGQLVVTRNWRSAFRDEALGCDGAIPGGPRQST